MWKGVHVATSTWNTSLASLAEGKRWDMRLKEAAWTPASRDPDSPALSLTVPSNDAISLQRLWPSQVNLFGDWRKSMWFWIQTM